MKRNLFVIAICTLLMQSSFAAVQGGGIIVNGDFSVPVEPMIDTAPAVAGVWVICQANKGKELVLVENHYADSLSGNTIKFESRAAHTFNDGYLAQSVTLDKSTEKCVVSMRVKILKGDSAQIGVLFTSEAVDGDDSSTTISDLSFIEVNESKDIDGDGWVDVSKVVDNPSGDYFCVWLGGDAESVLVDDVAINIPEGSVNLNDREVAGDGVCAELPPYIAEKLPDSIKVGDKGTISVWYEMVEVPVRTFMFHEPGSELDVKIGFGPGHIKDKGYLGYKVDANILTGTFLNYKNVHKDLLLMTDKTLHNGTIVVDPEFKWVVLHYKKCPEGKYMSYLGDFSILMICDKEDIAKAKDPTIKIKIATSKEVKEYSEEAKDVMVVPPFTIENEKFVDFPKEGQKIEEEEQVIEFWRMLLTMND